MSYISLIDNSGSPPDGQAEVAVGIPLNLQRVARVLYGFFADVLTRPIVDLATEFLDHAEDCNDLIRTPSPCHGAELKMLCILCSAVLCEVIQLSAT